METVFSTASIHPRDRFDCWHGIACQQLVGHDSCPEDRQTFKAELQSGSLGAVDLILFKNSPMTVARESQHIRGMRDDDVLICRQIDGQMTIEQDHREVTLNPGDITLLDPRRPYAGRLLRNSQLLVVKTQRRLLEARLGNINGMTARAIRTISGDDRLTSSFMGMLPDQTDVLSPAMQAVVANQILDLVAISMAAIADGAPKISSSRSLVFVTVSAAIDARLGDPRLTANDVADAVGFSVRYANSVLADAGTSLHRLIQSRRLERCRTALQDPAQLSRSVSDIAYSWGFSDMTHFGRRFRTAYGMLPMDCRRAARQ